MINGFFECVICLTSIMYGRCFFGVARALRDDIRIKSGKFTDYNITEVNFLMTIGLVTLGIVAVLMFFGAAEKYFDRLGLTSWLTFLLVLALIIGAVMPEVAVGSFVMTISGFAVPLVVFVILLTLAAKSGNALRTVLALVIVAMSTVALRLLIGVNSATLVLVSSLLIGFVGGTLAYLAAGSRIGTLAGAIGGCVLGDVVSAGFMRMFYGVETYTIGGFGIFDSLVIAAVFGLVVAELVSAVRRMTENRRAAARGLDAEAGEDVGLSAGGENAAESADVSDENDAEAAAQAQEEAGGWVSDDKNQE